MLDLTTLGGGHPLLLFYLWPVVRNHFISTKIVDFICYCKVSPVPFYIVRTPEQKEMAWDDLDICSPVSTMHRGTISSNNLTFKAHTELYNCCEKS